MIDAEAPIPWPPNLNGWLIGKHSDAEKYCWQKNKVTGDEMVYGITNTIHDHGQALGEGEGQGSLNAAVYGIMKSQTWLGYWTKTANRNDVRQKANWTLFLFNFKTGRKAVETTHNINDAFGQGTANEPLVLWLFQFCKGNERLAFESWHQPIEIIEADLPSQLILEELPEKLSKNLTLSILWSFSFWSKLERWKSLLSGYLMCWLQIKKSLKCHLILHNNEPFLNQIVMCGEKSILCDNWQWDDQLRCQTKKKLQNTS